MKLSELENSIVLSYVGMKYNDILESIPLVDRRYKCHTCYYILNQPQLKEGRCPICGEKQLEPMCPIDNVDFIKDIHESIEICPLCDKPIDPITHNHNVVAITRVTGYLQDFSGFNAGKQQEVKDRVRNNIDEKGECHETDVKI